MTTDAKGPEGSSNCLPEGMTKDDLLDVVKRSGYPLQTVVAKTLRDRGFSVLEEWTYIDRDSGDVRAMDLLAEESLYELGSEMSRARPHVQLLIECKQSELPYLFFQTEALGPASVFPRIAGLRKRAIKITSDDDPSSWRYSPQTCLGIEQHPFAVSPPAFCRTFAKLARKGKSFEATGTDAYVSSVLPLVKATHYLSKAASPGPLVRHFDCRALLAICVLDAPMVLVGSGADPHSTSFVQWVRLVRDEPRERSPLSVPETFTVDFVHREFFTAYVADWVRPYSADFARRVEANETVLAECRAFVPNMGSRDWSDISGALQPFTKHHRKIRRRLGGKKCTD